jgi:predicted dehydrogenase
VSYETGFSRGLSRVRIQQIDDRGSSVSTEPAMDWESPFRRELRHFHDCIVNGTASRSPISEVGKEIGLVIDIIGAYQSRG